MVTTKSQDISSKIKTTYLTKYNFQYKYLNKIYNFLGFLRFEYPYFEYWYFRIVFYNELLNRDRCLIVKEYEDEIVAVAIVKFSENKICTFRVSEKYQKIGIGTELMRETLELLKCENPLITVTEKRVPDYQKLFDKFNFKLSEVLDGYYTKNNKEYIYNKK